MLATHGFVPAGFTCQNCQTGSACTKRAPVEPFKCISVCNPQFAAPKPAKHRSFSRAAQNGNEETLWLQFFSDPSQWWDNRLTKRNPNYPDFKHKTTKEGLWVDSWSKPSWVEGKLVDVANSGQETSREQLWKKFLSDPSEWWDFRFDKTNTRYPDFRHKRTKEALWVGGNSTPKWAKEKLSALSPNALERSIFFWNSKLLAFVKSGQHEKVLELFQQMQVEGVRLDKFTFMQVLKACSSLTALEEGRYVHAQIINSKCEADLTLGNCLANMYSKCGSIEDACRVFNDMDICNVVGWSAIMQGYIRCGMGEKALRAFYQMQLEEVQPDSIAFVAALNACSTIGALEEGRCIHAQVIGGGYETDLFVLSCLVDMYSESQSLEDACRTFNKVALHDVVCWNAMIAAFTKFGQRKKALQLFKQMQRESIRPNKVTFVSVLNACASSMTLEEGKCIHVQIIEAGYESDSIVGSCLVDMYSKFGDLENASIVFKGLLNRDAVCWNSMMAGYVKGGHGKKALELYQQMQQSKVEPTSHTFASLLNACSSIGSLKDGVRVHLEIMKSGCELDTVVASCLLDMYAKCGSIEDACKVFENMSTRDVVAWSAMVVSYVKCGQGEKALELFRQMQQQHVELDSTAFICVLNACANVAALEIGKSIHAQIIQKGYELDTTIGNCLIDMYAKCGSIKDAFRVFENMLTRDVVSWNTMIAGYAMHGLGKEACCIFEQMKEEDARMDSVTFVGLLSACSHAGRFDEGHYYFECLSSFYGILATVEHYNCMVDLLGRSGLLDEALDMIKKMACRPNLSTFLTLLGACRIHGNLQMGEWLAKQVLALDPKNPSGYILLSNIYASGKWDSGERVQQLRNTRSVH